VLGHVLLAQFAKGQDQETAQPFGRRRLHVVVRRRSIVIEPILPFR
jgi:hypothetical protein